MFNNNLIIFNLMNIIKLAKFTSKTKSIYHKFNEAPKNIGVENIIQFGDEDTKCNWNNRFS
jgi:hypothetical protein